MLAKVKAKNEEQTLEVEHSNHSVWPVATAVIPVDSSYMVQKAKNGVGISISPPNPKPPSIVIQRATRR